MSGTNSHGLKRVAFVAMPFGTKPTDLAVGNGPASVDFDALWQRAIFPALTDLKYMPVRADNQTGSVIIKDMLQQLMFADLVLADISIANGNVYYEAGVRHAARPAGCILINADWAKPLFDLRQITQLRYPFPSDNPTDADYQAVADSLRAGIPRLAGSEGPVYSLTRISESDTKDSRELDELSKALFDFQTNLRSARMKAADGIKAPLRALLDDEYLDRLPVYALTELVDAVRDHLNWGELDALLKRLPERVDVDPFFLEQKALAMGKQGQLHDAIALLEEVVEKHGETPERFGTIGGRYRELARAQASRQKKRTYQARTIDCYRSGMRLDLNQYYCAHKLMIALTERNRLGDSDEAARISTHVLAAGERARELQLEDEWLDAAMLIQAFFAQDYPRACSLMDAVIGRGWSRWKLISLRRDLGSVAARIDEANLPPFQELLDDLFSALPVPQESLMTRLLPRIREDGGRYRKSTRIHARPAREGEVVVSTTEDGEETSNSAGADDMVIRNLTKAREEYLVGRAKFNVRYKEIEAVDEQWTLYASLGEIRALEITHDITSMLDVGEEFFIMAPWGTEQIAREGDMLAAPLPDLGEIYRIAPAEFKQTYELVS